MTVEVLNFGCRLNAYESQVMKNHAEAAGMVDTILVNTCAVTKEAERQARQAIRRAKRQHPHAQIIVSGCSAQIDPTRYAEMPEVSKVLGNEEKLKVESYSSVVSRQSSVVSDEEGQHKEAEQEDARRSEATTSDQVGAQPARRQEPEALSANSANNNPKILVNDIMSITETAAHLVSGMDDHTRAFVQVQNGCNHRCTFCIIPYGRGNSRSVPLGEVVAQVRTLVENGVKEVVITGVDISDYGKDLPGQPSLGQLLRRLLALVPDLPRLRISSIDAVEVDDDFYRLLAEEPRVMPHLHVSLQAGDNMILKRMKRRHLREDAIAFAQKVRAVRPDMVFGADIITGFPTETEEMFQNTLALVEEMNLTYLHVFPYSERPGTPAARMPQVAPAIRKERAARLRALGEAQVEKFLRSRIGKPVTALVEKNGEGRCEHYAPVRFDDGSVYPEGSLITARITGMEQGYLQAEQIA